MVISKNCKRREALAEPSNTHTPMATPLLLSARNAANPISETAIWVAASIYLKGLRRAIIISGTRELILRGVEMSQIFCWIIQAYFWTFEKKLKP